MLSARHMNELAHRTTNDDLQNTPAAYRSLLFRITIKRNLHDPCVSKRNFTEITLAALSKLFILEYWLISKGGTMLEAGRSRDRAPRRRNF
jgi:hypothetical protein